MVKLTPEEKKKLLQHPRMKALKKAYDKAMKGSGKMKGMGFWNNVYKAMKKVGGKALEVDKFLRDSKIISKVASGIETGALGLTAFQPELAEFTLPAAGIAEVVKDTAQTVGYGKYRNTASYSLSTPSRLGMKGGGSSAFGSVFEPRRGKVKF